MRTSVRTLAALLAALVAIGAARAPAVQTWVEPRTGLVFVAIPAGRFVMGSAGDEPHREPGERPHEVRIRRPFHLGKYEVTQRQWAAVMKTRPSWFDGAGDDLPVERVNWFEVQEFLRRLTAGSADSRFRLPTEAEWEYACRAGTSTAYGTGDSLTAADANIDPAAPDDARAGRAGRRQPVAVGSYPPNGWGLHDMHGNVWEWTDDRFCPYPEGPLADPRGSCASQVLVIRGGSWHFRADSARCALRYTHRPADRGFSLGFRVARDPRP